MKTFLKQLVCAVGVATTVAVSSAQEISFSRDVRPILAARCYACHGPDAEEGDLALHVQDRALSSIEPGDPDNSELLRRVLSEDESERMPAEGEPLSEEEINILRQWIAEGAHYEAHWAFEPPEQREPPQVEDNAWVANPIDAFILAKLEAEGLAPASPAEKRVLIRRLTFDLTGLPPTPEEVAQFVNDESPHAYERLVDRLLASPRYGEKWARHWLDVVRYAESNSYERDTTKPYAWKYRDYVIRSLNEDKPYDQFIREQLAGDELDDPSIESITATGYYRLGTWDDEPADKLQARYDDLDSILSTTSQAFLGLTVGCARCHDHKIDPIPQADYYSLLAFFMDVTPYAEKPRLDPKYNSLWDFSGPLQIKRRESLNAERHQIFIKRIKIEDAAIKKMTDADRRLIDQGKKQQLLDEKLEAYTTEEEYRRYHEILEKLAAFDRKMSKLPRQELVLSLAKCDPHPEPTRIMMRGNPHVPGEEVAPRFPELFGLDPPDIPDALPDARSAGRRRVLADWIASAENPLTARVIANRVWQHHFGRGLVRSPNNFGLLGVAPTHPELLDWLSLWLVENEWRLKPLHRLIVTSNAYRMSSAATEEGLAADPANNLFWRFDMRRLTAEEIRDTVMYVSGRLDETLYGPSIYPQLSDEVLATQSKPGENWHTTPTNQSARRSIYIHVKRSLTPPELSNFDFPDTDSSCEARFNTVQAAQALTLLHGDYMQNHAKYLAERIKQDEQADNIESQVQLALKLALQRDADLDAVSDGLELIDKLQSAHNLDADEAFNQYCLMVLNLNEFVYLD